MVDRHRRHPGVLTGLGGTGIINTKDLQGAVETNERLHVDLVSFDEDNRLIRFDPNCLL